MEEAARAANARKAREEREEANKPGVISSALDALGDIFGSDNDLKEQGKNANKKAIKHLEINDKGYFKGHHKWVDGDGYNNVNYYIGDDGNYYSVNRMIDVKAGLITIVGEPTRLNKSEYNKKIRGLAKDTWCNYAENAFGQENDAPILLRHPQTNVEIDVNVAYKALEQGLYNNEKGSYDEVKDYKEAERLASEGYHVFAIKLGTPKRKNGEVVRDKNRNIVRNSGHIAKLMGGYIENIKSQGNLNIWQAGTRRSGENLFGPMSLEKGFRRVSGQRFYVWKSRRRR